MMVKDQCHYCGVMPFKPFKKHGTVYMLYNGIDRLDNNAGYTVTNTVTCCSPCNKLKGTFNRFRFLEQVRAVYARIAESTRFIGYNEIREWRDALAASGKTLAVVSGCFDLVHVGHLAIFSAARRMADVVLVGVNSDRAVKLLKGDARPIIQQHDRALLLTSFESVDHATIFDGETATEFLCLAKPTVWVKGGDYTMETLNQDEVKAVLACGGRVHIEPLLNGYSTTKTIQKISALEN